MSGRPALAATGTEKGTANPLEAGGHAESLISKMVVPLRAEWQHNHRKMALGGAAGMPLADAIRVADRFLYYEKGDISNVG